MGTRVDQSVTVQEVQQSALSNLHIRALSNFAAVFQLCIYLVLIAVQ